VRLEQRCALKISLVIPAYNEEGLIEGTLRSVRTASAAFAERGWQTELIVCDNNSTDRTAELARCLGATVIFEPINQIARARNRGAAAATGNWLIFVDADSTPDSELFDEVGEQIAFGKCIAGGCTVRLDGNFPLAQRAIGLWNLISRVFRLPAGSFIFCEAAAFREIGGFSNEYFAGEELDLGKRLKLLARAKGKQIVILHRHPLTTSARKIRLYTVRQHFWFMLKALLLPDKVLRNREACYIWYDGRR
jgi:glycosyltransferase involved in cell wall biosynthesis